MTSAGEKHWVDLMNVIHDSVKGGMKYNTGTLLMVLSRPVSDEQIIAAEKAEKPMKSKHSSNTTTPSKSSSGLDTKAMNP